MKEDLFLKSVINISTKIGTYHTLGIPKYFNNGSKVDVYHHFYFDLISIDKNGELYILSRNQFDKNFYTIENWRDNQLKKLI